MTEIPEQIKAIRGSMSQGAFASRLGVHVNTVGKWERGTSKPDYEALRKILEEFPNLNPAWLITGQGIMFKPSKKELPQYPLDAELFAQVTEAVLEEVETYARPPRAKTLMQLIRLIHDEIKEGEMEEQEVKKNVKRFLKIAS